MTTTKNFLMDFVRSSRWVPSGRKSLFIEVVLSFDINLSVVGNQKIVENMGESFRGLGGLNSRNLRSNPLKVDISGLIRDGFKLQTKSEESNTNCVLSQSSRKGRDTISGSNKFSLSVFDCDKSPVSVGSSCAVVRSNCGAK